MPEQPIILEIISEKRGRGWVASASYGVGGESTAVSYGSTRLGAVSSLYEILALQSQVESDPTDEVFEGPKNPKVGEVINTPYGFRRRTENGWEKA